MFYLFFLKNRVSLIPNNSNGWIDHYPLKIPLKWQFEGYTDNFQTQPHRELMNQFLFFFGARRSRVVLQQAILGFKNHNIAFLGLTWFNTSQNFGEIDWSCNSWDTFESVILCFPDMAPRSWVPCSNNNMMCWKSLRKRLYLFLWSSNLTIAEWQEGWNATHLQRNARFPNHRIIYHRG